MDERARACLELAIDDATLPHDAALRATLVAYFAWAIAAMATYPHAADDVPAGLRLPRWSWDGPVQ